MTEGIILLEQIDICGNDGRGFWIPMDAGLDREDPERKKKSRQKNMWAANSSVRLLQLCFVCGVEYTFHEQRS